MRKVFRSLIQNAKGLGVKRAGAAILSVALVLLAIAWSPQARAEATFSFFYSNLGPHGSWLVSGQYGRVWQPDIYSSGWNPYYDGHWAYTDLGWIWVSDYNWGAIPYHYGTWVEDPALGWIWVPGYVWAPAWVVFRSGPDYIGWAPVSPGFSVGLSATFRASVGGPFVFVSAGNFLAPRVRTCIVPESRTTVIIRNTRVVNNLKVENNIVVNRGIEPSFIERASGHRVREVPVERVPRAGPGPRVTRHQLSVDPSKLKHGLRVAEPTPEKHPPRVVGRDARTDMRRTSQGTTTSGPAASPRTAPRARSQPQAVTARVNASRPPDRHAGALERNRDSGSAVSTHPRGRSPDGFTSARPPVRREPPDRRIGMTSKAQGRDRLVRNPQPARNRVKATQRSNKGKGRS